MSDSETRGNCKKKGGVTQTRTPNVEDQNAITDKNGSKAPTGLLAEFLSSIMTKDYQTAFKYCAKILSYEPDNTTARDFYPLILEKLELISNDEYEDSSTDSYSSESNSSGSSLTQTYTQSSDDDKRLSSGDEKYSTIGRKSAVKDIKASTLPTDERQTKNKKVETEKSRNCFTPAKESSARAPTIKTNSKGKVGMKAIDSSRLLIHPTKTKILKCSNISNEGKKKQFKSQKPSQKGQEMPNFSENPSSSRILLYPTRTITFPKVISSQTKCDKD